MPVDRRRTDTRRRAREVALRLFTEQGYEQTSLAQVAERLGITRSAVLHHYPSKEALLTSGFADLLPGVDRAIALARGDGRAAALDAFAGVLAGPDGGVVICAHLDEYALRELPGARTLQVRLGRLTRLLAPGDDVDARMRGRLALGTLIMAEARGRELGATIGQRRAAARALAGELIRAS